MSISQVLRQCPLGTPGSSPAPEATLERGAPRKNPRELDHAWPGPQRQCSRRGAYLSPDRRRVVSDTSHLSLESHCQRNKAVSRGASMKQEDDFSGGERGKFYHAEAELALPVYLDPDVAVFVRRQRVSDIASALVGGTTADTRAGPPRSAQGALRASVSSRSGRPAGASPRTGRVGRAARRDGSRQSPSRLSPPTRSGCWVTRVRPRRCARALRRCRKSVVHWIKDYPEFLVERHRRPPRRGVGEHHAPFPPADGCRRTRRLPSACPVLARSPE